MKSIRDELQRSHVTQGPATCTSVSRTRLLRSLTVLHEREMKRENQKTTEGRVITATATITSPSSSNTRHHLLHCRAAITEDVGSNDEPTPRGVGRSSGETARSGSFIDHGVFIGLNIATNETPALSSVHRCCGLHTLTPRP